jgi:hypothetical protein
LDITGLTEAQAHIATTTADAEALIQTIETASGQIDHVATNAGQQGLQGIAANLAATNTDLGGAHPAMVSVHTTLGGIHQTLISATNAATKGEALQAIATATTASTTAEGTTLQVAAVIDTVREAVIAILNDGGPPSQLVHNLGTVYERAVALHSKVVATGESLKVLSVATSERLGSDLGGV